ncbi:phosphoadenosine phosphosulfate reductase family protein [Bisbaumannia pacifica]|uniref:Phosphoadenosine phosphosulfate reductase family protein n=1 Tax=Bisbaumannia pacifica TaxID=77098 RepID=A0ABD4KWG5_9GAMM|nr:phosphoadenosine phosphosulfate reductase family protein [Halomonas pacifica]MBH8578747.1 phosphoadenosine phosphosulfate reductase family protein [Halomonas pacifica]
MSRLFISFSGGETSAFMAQWLLQHRANHYDDIVCLFANTGQENEETLRFVQQCDEAFGLDVIWLEAEVKQGRARSGHRVVSYGTARRKGEPFEAVIQKYGISNQNWPHCTRELKLNPMLSYLASIGWEPGSFDTAIGIRADEMDRISPLCREKRLTYPLISDIEMTKPRINAWWSNQPFRLQLKGYEGNCKWCWKKSLRKHLTLLTEHPEWYDFPERMEALYASVNPKPDLPDRVFFREGRSTRDLRALACAGGFTPAHDEAQVYEDQLALDLDTSNGCSESCEIDFEEVA